MSWIKNLLRKQETGPNALKTTESNVNNPSTTPSPEALATQPPTTWEQWFNALPPEEQRRISAKVARIQQRQGIPVVCANCHKAGGTLKKLSDNVYVHEKCPE